jgi:hypothetical protein
VTAELTYRNPLVRDLAWAVSSPPLLQRSDPGVRWLDPDWFANLTDSYRNQLALLDRDPQPLREVIECQKDRRLGNYFESLWRYWLSTNDRYRLLYANLPLRSAARTIGEFDFLVEDRDSGKTLHWELAVKFYLGVGDTSQAGNWWGPALRDRLDIKTEHLLEHQSRLSRHRQAESLFRELEIQVDETWLILKGRLFYPLAQAADSPQGAGAGHLRGFWTGTDSLPALQDSAWLLLERRQWLAPVGQVDPADCLTTPVLLEQCRDEPIEHPVCLARIKAGMEVERGFIVPDDWSKGTERTL